jgi:hypothetical protein
VKPGCKLGTGYITVMAGEVLKDEVLLYMYMQDREEKREVVIGHPQFGA